jgi:2-keto-4-pentenoate hydratase/2-oxohepta-3-ene-1,7-dioic acid hydratase in catechol pathway
MARTPPRFLSPGDMLESTIEGIGSMTTTFTATFTATFIES